MSVTQMQWEPVRAKAQQWLDDNVNMSRPVTTPLRVVELRSTSDPIEVTSGSYATRQFVQGPIDYHLVDQFGGQHPVPPDVVNEWLSNHPGITVRDTQAKKVYPVTDEWVKQLLPTMGSINCYPRMDEEWANAVVRIAVRKITQRYITPHSVSIEQTVSHREYSVVFHHFALHSDVYCHVTEQELAMMEVVHCMWCGEGFPGQDACEAHEEGCGN